MKYCKICKEGHNGKKCQSLTNCDCNLCKGMPTWEQITQTHTDNAQTEIEAESEDEALEIAREQAESYQLEFANDTEGEQDAVYTYSVDNIEDLE